ncbi:two-component sensor histidine kinase [Niabella ginsenosidivorans]|uniref:histidine kinase n=2 Tax=Niabella ginsenosidivorans TaxID=1176587 RepID=A0A1A9HYW1_9BACT|nr:two-component sensor histidine kinase [Niabella ginsenosidivorans]
MEQKLKRSSGKTRIIFYLLVVYILAALVWLFILLELQNRELHKARIEHLNTAVKDVHTAEYKARLAKIEAAYRRNHFKYAGEGTVFLGLILWGALFVYRYITQQSKLQQQQQNFTMAVTHELKTPIAVARLNLETLLKRNLDEEKRRKLILMTLEETARLNFLTNNILISSQLEGHNHKINKEDLDLSDLLTDRVEEFEKRFPDRAFQKQIEEDADINGDPLLLQILVNNLIENAIKYSPKEGPIRVTLTKQSQSVIVSVTDEGPGIPEEEKRKIFTKFYRIGNEATRKKQGTGLGLYLCDKIAKDHNADISVTNHEPNGSTFAVKFHISS